jgi:hypothetical protein
LLQPLKILRNLFKTLLACDAPLMPLVYYIKLFIQGIFVNEISAMKKGIPCFVKGANARETAKNKTEISKKFRKLCETEMLSRTHAVV